MALCVSPVSPKMRQSSFSADSLESVCLSMRYKDKRIRILGDDRLQAELVSPGGYASILGTHGAVQGNWYFEMTVDLSKDPVKNSIRVGWSTRRSRFDFPIGSDIFSYAMRTSDGQKIVQGMRYEYFIREGSKFPVKSGDMIGCYLEIPGNSNPSQPDYEDPLWTPGLLCDVEDPPEPDILPGSRIGYSLNGEFLGWAFHDVVAGVYYPAVSLYGNKTKISANFEAVPGEGVTGYQPISGLFDPELHMKPPKRPPNFIPRGTAKF
jgi:Set1/Ash2 histone methyltransferase complex subunit ASH2